LLVDEKEDELKALLKKTYDMDDETVRNVFLLLFSSLEFLF
jgi:hypothetical protein